MSAPRPVRNVSTVTAKIMGRRAGSTMRKRMRPVPAPMLRAASMVWWSIAASDERRKSMWFVVVAKVITMTTAK